MNKRLCFAFIGLFGLCVCAIRAADDHYVTPPGQPGSGTNNPPYTNWADAATNIQWAVDAAAAGETVYVTNGSYCVTNQIMVVNRITLKSMNGYSNTLVYADWPAYTNNRCFFVAGTGTVDGFAISNGHIFGGSNENSGGGGAYVANYGVVQNCYFVNNVFSNAGRYSGGGGAFVGTNAIVSNCLFVSNMTYQSLGNPFSGYGGALFMMGGKVVDSTIISNYAQGSGGGVFAHSLSANLISNCFIAKNSAGTGGGVRLSYGTITDSVISNNAGSSGGGIFDGENIRNCLIIDNSAYGGGGVYLSNIRGMISNCVITGNRNTSDAYGGGGIWMGYNTVNHLVIGCRINNNRSVGLGGGGIYVTNTGQIVNSLIFNNTNASPIGKSGGGVRLGHSAVTLSRPYGLINCTIVNNYSTNEGGGIAAVGVSNYVVNCIISSNRSSSGIYPDVYNAGDNSNNFWYCCANVTSAPLPAAQGNITNDPFFTDTVSGNWRLSAPSPCINSGTNQAGMTNMVDLDGRIRIRYGTVDMGAYEAIYEGTIYKF